MTPSLQICESVSEVNTEQFAYVQPSSAAVEGLSTPHGGQL